MGTKTKGAKTESAEYAGAESAGAESAGAEPADRGRKRTKRKGARFKVWRAPVRLATGAFILDSGLTKQDADDQTAESLHGFAAGTYPQVRNMPPQQFVQLLSAGEIALGTALLVPVIPAYAAGAGLAAFSSGLLGLYARTPGMRQEGTVRPTEQGLALAKDVWMLGIGTALVIDDLIERAKR